MWTLFWKFKYVCLMTTPTYSFGVYGFGIAGALAIFGGFLGCCGIYYEKRVVICMVSFKSQYSHKYYINIKYNNRKILNDSISRSHAQKPRKMNSK